MVLYIILGLILVTAAYIIFIFNDLVKARQLVKNGWSDIAIQLKRRADLIPRLVDTVKAYAKHEKTLFEDVITKRNAALGAGDNPGERGAAENSLRRPVGKLIALAEDYPDLKANQNFLDLQEELADTEDTIEMARRFYNGATRELNTKVQSFPANIIASSFGFKLSEYFEIDAADAAVPEVEFGV